MMAKDGENTQPIQFLDGESVASLEVGTSLARAVAVAALANDRGEDASISFTSLFIGLFTASDPAAAWLERQITESRTLLGRLLRIHNLSADRIDGLRAARVPSDRFARPFRRSQAVIAAFAEGERHARALDSILAIRHLIAAYISLPLQADDFRELTIDRAAWAAAFASEMATLYPMEMRFWHDLPAWFSASRPSDPPAAPVPDMQKSPALDLRWERMEEHVAQALRRADAAARARPITAAQLLAAVIELAGSANSPAFRRLAQLVPSSSVFLSGNLSNSSNNVIDFDQIILPDEAPLSERAPLAEDRLHEELRRQLSWAQRLLPDAAQSPTLWGRDLVTAALLCHDPELAERLEQAQRPLDVVRDLWYLFVTADGSYRSPEQWRAWWQEAGVPIPGPRRSGYATETDEGDDKLGIQSEARAFARLILDKDVKAPLSIGLLGDWGSGKSFFIEELKKQIHSLEKDNRPELYSNVVEIEFNAWHASDTNLWASLVTYIFDEIWEKVSSSSAEKTPELARKRLLQQIEQARGAVHEAEVQVELGRAALAKAEQDLERRRKELAWNHYVKTVASEKLLQVAENAGWHQSLKTINEVDAAVRMLAASGNRLRLLVAALAEKPLRHIALPVALLVLATAAVWLVCDQYGSASWFTQLAKFVSAVLGSVGVLVGPLKAASSKVAKLSNLLGEIQRQYDQKLKELEQQKPAEAEHLATARRELESAEASVSAAKTRLGELLNQQAALDPRRRLGAFLQERVQSTLYRSQQGIISLVHKDFRELSKYMKDLREASAQAGASALDESGIKPFDRIVLYVDDLDRCRPDHVVNMLEAVHLLLALDLFVVVVAVDSRWLTRALEVHYKELLSATDGREDDGMRASTPQNYLEKIFQITYALGPMEPAFFQNYVSFLTGSEPRARQTAERTAAGNQAPFAGPPTQGADSRSATQPGKAVAPQKTAGPSQKSAMSESELQSSAPAKPAPLDPPARLPPPHAVRIDQAEQALICRLLPLLPTPRIAKRLVNVYRVIKAGKSVAALEEFEKGQRAETCLLMLAILFGRPSVASALFRALHERRPPFDRPKEKFIEALQRGAAMPERSPRGQEEWQNLLQTLTQLQIAATVEECAREPIEVARYSLVSGHDWHTWQRAS